MAKWWVDLSIISPHVFKGGFGRFLAVFCSGSHSCSWFLWKYGTVQLDQRRLLYRFLHSPDGSWDWWWLYWQLSFSLAVFPRIASFTEKVVPVMAALYICGALIVLILNIGNLPSAVASIFQGGLLSQGFGWLRSRHDGPHGYALWCGTRPLFQ